MTNIGAVAGAFPAASAAKAKMDTLKPILVSPAEGCRITGTGHTKFYEAMNDGSLPAVKMGRKTLIKMVDLLAWVETLPRYEPRVDRKERDPAPEIAKAKTLVERRRAAKVRRSRVLERAANASRAPPADL
jgi:excisionase family DNA binding protein